MLRVAQARPNAMNMCDTSDDDVFGPTVGPHCRNGFDFTLLFEESILELLPALIFVVIGPVRIGYLARRAEKTRPNPQRKVKAIGVAIFIVCQIAILCVTELRQRRVHRPTTLIAAAGNLVAALVFLPLSWLEDAKSPRPSSLLSAYLVLTTLFDLPQIRTQWLLHRGRDEVAALLSASAIIKIGLVVLEEQSKRGYLKPPYRNLPPHSTGGLFSESLLLWLNALIRRGLHPPPLSIDDLEPLDEGLSSLSAGKRLQAAWDTRKYPERKLELVLAVCRALFWPMLRPVVPRLCMLALAVAQPFLVASTIDLIKAAEDENTTTKVFCLIGATALIFFGQAVVSVHYEHNLYRAMVMARGALVTLIYNRALLLQNDLHSDAAPVTLMSSDTDQITSTLNLVQVIWARTLSVLIGAYLLALELGWASLFPIIMVVLSSFGSSWVARRIGGHAKAWMSAIQKRVGATNSILENMKSVKMMGFGDAMTAMLQQLRVLETNRIKEFRWDIVWQNLVANVPGLFTPVVTLGTYALIAAAKGNSDALDVVKAFKSISIMSLVSDPAASLLSMIPMAFAGIGSFERIQKFLLETPKAEQRILITSSSNVARSESSWSPEAEHQAALSASRVSIRPSPSADRVLHDLTFRLPTGSITVVLGSIASGKTTFLRALLGEAYIGAGDLRVRDGDVAYCAQDPWLPSTTIRRVICGSIKVVDETWYESCLRACALEEDLSALVEGDRTMVGTRGANLSGGQRHRVALARALYARPKIALLDDMLSALDPLTRTTVVESIFGEEGMFKRIGCTVVLVTHATECLPYADRILVLSKGTLSFDGTYNEAAITGVIDKVLPSMRRDDERGGVETGPLAKTNRETNALEVENLTRTTGDLAVYKYYLQSIGWRRSCVFLAAVILLTVSEAFIPLWLKWWTESGGSHLTFYLAGYFMLPTIVLAANGFFIWGFSILISPASANKLHYVLLKTVMSAPMSFFSLTPTGKILNMFSQDMTIIEGSLAVGAALVIIDVFQLVMSLGLVITVSPYLTLTVPFLFGALYALQHVYLRTSKQLRYIDLEAKSPLYSHFLETTSGIATIRAFGWQGRSRTEHHELLDISQRPYYLLFVAQRWLILMLSLIVSTQSVIVVALALGLRHRIDPGFLGVSLTTIIGLDGKLTRLITAFTDLEISLGSIARVKKLEDDVPPEDDLDGKPEPPASWPSRGAIEFHNVTASYNSKAVALRDVSVLIKSGQKLGLCGRTGSGKSSLVGTMLRLLDIDQGRIVIDGLDISRIPPNAVRSRIVTLPQDALIISGSVRQNLDPLGKVNNESIIAALDRVGLWTNVLAERDGGLDADLPLLNLSKGQQQLFGLARALLGVRQGAKIVLLDEPTSNIDRATEARIRLVLQEDCDHCTMITIAHRMETIMESDVVAVMDEGRLAEFGSPTELLSQNKIFAKLVNG